MKHRPISAILITLTALTLASCDGQTAKETSIAPSPRVETASHGDVTVELTVSPGEISFSRNAILTLAVTHPPEITIEVPDLRDRVEGFESGHSFDRTTTRSGSIVFERILRLTPKVTDRYRIAPIPISYHSSTGADKKQWFPTPAIHLQRLSVDASLGSYKEQVTPVWIRPTTREIAIYVGLAVLAVMLILLLIKLVRMAVRQVRLLRMSPRERALEELRVLLAKDLVDKDMVKEFYLELTMIVRLFIERGYLIKATEQTTEEFLASAATDARFEAGILAKLRAFLQSADLVKFAAFQPDTDTTRKAIEDARGFIRVESSSNPDAGRKQEVTDA